MGYEKHGVLSTQQDFCKQALDVHANPCVSPRISLMRVKANDVQNQTQSECL